MRAWLAVSALVVLSLTTSAGAQTVTTTVRPSTMDLRAEPTVAFVTHVEAQVLCPSPPEAPLTLSLSASPVTKDGPMVLHYRNGALFPAGAEGRIEIPWVKDPLRPLHYSIRHDEEMLAARNPNVTVGFKTSETWVAFMDESSLCPLVFSGRHQDHQWFDLIGDATRPPAMEFGPEGAVPGTGLGWTFAVTVIGTLLAQRRKPTNV